MTISPENMCTPSNLRAQSEHFSSGEHQQQLIDQQLFGQQSIDPISEQLAREKIDFEKQYSSKFLGDENYIILSPPMGSDPMDKKYLFNPISEKNPVLRVDIPLNNRVSTRFTRNGILLKENHMSKSGAIMISSRDDKAFKDGVIARVAYTLFIGVQMPAWNVASDGDDIIEKVKEKLVGLKGGSIVKLHSPGSIKRPRWSNFKDYHWIEYRIRSTKDVLVIDIDDIEGTFPETDATSDIASFLLQIDEVSVQYNGGPDCQMFISHLHPDRYSTDWASRIIYKERTSEQDLGDGDEEVTPSSELPTNNRQCTKCISSKPKSDYYSHSEGGQTVHDEMCKSCTIRVEINNWNEIDSRFISFFSHMKIPSGSNICTELVSQLVLSEQYIKREAYGGVHQYLQDVWNYAPPNSWKIAPHLSTPKTIDAISEIKTYITAKYPELLPSNPFSSGHLIGEPDIRILDIITKREGRVEDYTLENHINAFRYRKPQPSALRIEDWSGDPDSNSPQYRVKNDQLFVKNGGRFTTVQHLHGSTVETGKEIDNFSKRQNIDSDIRKCRGELSLISNDKWSSMIQLSIGSRDGDLNLNNGNTFDSINLDAMLFVYNNTQGESSITQPNADDFAKMPLLRVHDNRIEISLESGDRLNFGARSIPQQIIDTLAKFGPVAGMFDGDNYSFIHHSCQAHRMKQRGDEHLHERELIIAIHSAGISPVPSDVMVTLMDYRGITETFGRRYGTSGHPGWGLQVSGSSIYDKLENYLEKLLLVDDIDGTIGIRGKFEIRLGIKINALWVLDFYIGAFIRPSAYLNWSGMDTDGSDGFHIDVGFFAGAKFDLGISGEVDYQHYNRYSPSTLYQRGLMWEDLWNKYAPSPVQFQFSPEDKILLKKTNLRSNVNRVDFILDTSEKNPFRFVEKRLKYETWETNDDGRLHKIRYVQTGQNGTFEGGGVKLSKGRYTQIELDITSNYVELDVQHGFYVTHGNSGDTCTPLGEGGYSMQEWLEYQDLFQASIVTKYIGKIIEFPLSSKGRVPKDSLKKAKKYKKFKGFAKGIDYNWRIIGRLGGFFKIRIPYSAFTGAFGMTDFSEENLASIANHFTNKSMEELETLYFDLYDVRSEDAKVIAGIQLGGRFDGELSVPVLMQPAWSINAYLKGVIFLGARFQLEWNDGNCPILRNDSEFAAVISAAKAQLDIGSEGGNNS